MVWHSHATTAFTVTLVALSGLCTIPAWRGPSYYEARCRNGTKTKANEEKEEIMGEGGLPPLRPSTKQINFELYESKWRKIECKAELKIQEVSPGTPRTHILFC